MLLPHMGSATIEGRIDMGEKVIINIKTFVDGHKPPDRVLPACCERVGGVSEKHEALLDRLADTIATLHPDRRIRVAIDGVDGAGKTMLADVLAPLVVAKGREVIRACVDDFHYPRASTIPRRRYSPDGFFLDSYDYDGVPPAPARSARALKNRGRLSAKHSDHRHRSTGRAAAATGTASGVTDCGRHLPASP